MYEVFLRELLEPLGIYDLSEESVSGAEIFALGAGLDTVSQQLEQDAERAVLRSAVAALSARERQIMELRFGLTDGVERTQKEAADALGISQSYISRLEKRIIRTLKARLESE